MSELAILDIFLHDESIATLTHLPGDRNLLAFNQSYVNNPHRSTLSLSFRDIYGDLITDTKSTRSQLPPFFANLLPEGAMREYLAQQTKVNPKREFFLLAALGKDLPGALKVNLLKNNLWNEDRNKEADKIIRLDDEETVLRFSLAGVQLKFSAFKENERLTLAANGVGGSWIVKLPSATYAGVPENEFAMMELARRMGLDVPETALVPIDQIKGLPKGIGAISNHAFVIKRFDRTAEGRGIHIEDFAQVFGVFPEKKYRAASYRNIAEVISLEIGEKGLVEFIRRFVFNALIGNGDMHLKNWSLIYPDKRAAALAPAYDFVSTIPYIPEDGLALTFVDSKAFSSLTYNQFKRFADKARLPESLVLDTVQESVKTFTEVWDSRGDLFLDKEIDQVINQHLQTVPIFKSVRL